MTTTPVLRFDHARDLVHAFLRTGPAPQPLQNLLDSLLGGIRELDRERADRERRLERTQLESETDPVTGLLNAEGWQRRLEREEDRRHRFGDPATVVTVQLTSTDPQPAAQALRAARTLRAAQALRAIFRPGTVLARSEPAQFAALLVGASDDQVAGHVRALRERLPSASVTSWEVAREASG